MIAWQTHYRPQKFADLHLQSVREKMQYFAQTGTLPQVLLFAGPKGTGKTSTARIIAAMLNSRHNAPAIDDYYLQKKSHSPHPLQDPDLQDPQVNKILQGDSYAVVEIDAASHRGIDDVRALQEQIYLPPAMSQVVVYILDEVHMFTTEAFNALLKVLEEPPAHAFFILATTELQKIPPTIASRCQIIHFQKASPTELLAAFKKIITQEKITAQPQALQEIARLSDGSFRDGVKFLQLATVKNKITSTTVAANLVGNGQAQIDQLISIILQKDSTQLVAFFATLRAHTFEEKFFLRQLTDFLYAQLIDNIKKKPQLALTQNQAHFLLAKTLTLAPNPFIPFLSLELTLLEIFSQSQKKAKTKRQ